MKASQALMAVLLVAALGIGGWFALAENPTGSGDGGGGTSVVDEDKGKASGVDAEGGKARGDSGGRESAGPERGARRVDMRPLGRGGLKARFVLGDRPLDAAKVTVVKAGAPSGSNAGTNPTARGPDKARDEGERSDRTGRVEFKGLRSGRYRLEVDHPDVATNWYSKTVPTCATMRSPTSGRSRSPRLCGLRGVVVDSSRRPLANASVGLRIGYLSGMMARQRKSKLRVKTDSSGKFELRRIKPAEYVLSVDHPRFVRSEQKAPLREGDWVDVGTIQLETGRELRGVVVDDRGRGISGAKVSYRHESSFEGNKVHYFATDRAAETDKRGEFELFGLPAKVSLMVEAEGFVPLRDHVIGDEETRVRLALERVQGISGLVKGHGEHAAKVWLLAQPRGRGAGIDLERRRSADVQEDGRFSFSKVRAGKYRVVADAPGFGTSRLERINVREGESQTVDLEIKEGPKLRVRVTDASNKPVANASVELRLDPGQELGPNVQIEGMLSGPTRKAQTASNGEVTLAGLWQGRAAMRVEHSDYLTYERPQLRITSNERVVDVRLERGGWIEGVVLGADGAGVRKAFIEVVKREDRPAGGTRVRMRRGGAPEPMRSVRSDDNGKFRAGPFRPGLYKVAARQKPGGWNVGDGATVRFSNFSDDADAETEARVAAGETSQVELRIVAPGEIEGAVRYQGRTIQGARVFARRKSGDGQDDMRAMFGGKKTATDERGRYSFGGLKPGTWLVSVKPPKGPVATDAAEVTVRSGAAARQDLELGGGVIQGRVAVAGGQKLEGYEVTIGKAGVPQAAQRVAFVMRSNGNQTSSGGMTMTAPGAPEPTPVKKDGTFRLDFVPAGKWTLRLRSSSGAAASGGVSRWTKDNVEVSDGQLVDLGTIRLEPSFPVKLKVFDSAGAPIAFGTLAIHRFANNKKGEQVFRGLVQSGAADVGRLEAGDYKVEFSHIRNGQAGGGPDLVGDLNVARDGTLTGRELRLPR